MVKQLNNTTKHAKASSVKINILEKDGNIILTITDDGVGFDVNDSVRGIGIVNIKSRAAGHKGLAEFISKPGKGCVLTVTFPIEDFNDANL